MTATGQDAPSRLLLIEDNRADAQLLTAQLRRSDRLPLTVRLENRLAAALTALDEEPFDCVLLDLGLPDTSGLDGLRTVVDHRPGLPVVVLTGNGDDATALAAVGLGAQDYLVKGTFDVALLERTVRYAIERGNTAALLEAKQQLNQSILDAIDANTAVLDRDGRITHVNRGWRRFTTDNGGTGPAVGVGADYLDACRKAVAAGGPDADVAGAVLDALRPILSGDQASFEIEYPCHSPDELRWFLLRISALPEHGAVTTHIPITEQKKLQLQLADQALRDPLTGLANRTLLFERLDLLLARRRSGPVSVLFVDLDGFKPVNDRLGHAAGDQLLRAVADRLTGCIRTEDTAARIGGDEFVVVTEVLDPTDAVIVAQRIEAALHEPVRLGDTEVLPSASVGVVVTHGVTCSAAGLVAEADAAMYQAKRQGPGHLHLRDLTRT